MELTKDECARLVAEGKRDADIAQVYGLSKDAVRKKRQRWGILVRPNKPANNPVTRAALRNLKAQGMSDKAIGEMFGIATCTVERYRRKWGIKSNANKKPVTLTEEELSAYKRNGYSDKAIGAIVGVSERVVAGWRKEYGIDALGRSPKYDAQYEAKIGPVRKLRADGLTLAEISEIVEVPKTTIGNWLDPAQRRNPADIERSTGMKSVYDWIIWYKAQNSGVPPTLTELSAYCGFSLSVVRKFVRELAKEGKLKIIERTKSVMRFIVVGEQWLPPTGVKIPAAPPRREPTTYRARKAEEKALRKADRLCECRRRADFYMEAEIGFFGKKESIPLCKSCAELAKQDGETVLPIEESK